MLTFFFLKKTYSLERILATSQRHERTEVKELDFAVHLRLCVAHVCAEIEFCDVHG